MITTLIIFGIIVALAIGGYALLAWAMYGRNVS